MADEIRALLQEQGKAFSEFKQRNDSRFEELQGRFDDIEYQWGNPVTGVKNSWIAGNRVSMDLREIRDAMRDFSAGREDRLNALTSVDNPTITPGFHQDLVRRLSDGTVLRRVCRVVDCRSDSLQIPVMTGKPGVSWIGETTERAELVSPALAKVTIPVAEQYALASVSQSAIDDSNFDLMEIVLSAIVDQFAAAEETAFLTGDGVQKPNGILNATFVTTADDTRTWNEVQYVPSGAADDFTADQLIALTYALRSSYRSNACFIANSETIRRLAQKKSGAGDYLWRQGLNASDPDRLCGYPLYSCESMPSVEGGNIPILFGDFKRAYFIVDRLGMRWLRDPYTNRPYVTLYAFKRSSGGLVDHHAVKGLKIGMV